MPAARPALTESQSAAAELVAVRMGDTGRDAGEVCAALCGRELASFCTEAELMAWYRRWRRKQDAAEHFRQTPEVLVDGEYFETVESPDLEDTESAVAAAEAEAGEPEPAGAGEIAGQILRFMDARLLRSTVLRWTETEAALRGGEQATQRGGAGRVQLRDGSQVEWLAAAVLIGLPGEMPRRVLPECWLNGYRAAGWKGCRHGAVRLKRIAATRRDAAPEATMQAVGTLLLAFQGHAAGLQKQVDVAAATGCTKANVSAKLRRMANNARSTTLATLRAREKMKEKMGRGRTPNTEHSTSNN